MYNPATNGLVERAVQTSKQRGGGGGGTGFALPTKSEMKYSLVKEQWLKQLNVCEKAQVSMWKQVYMYICTQLCYVLHVTFKKSAHTPLLGGGVSHPNLTYHSAPPPSPQNPVSLPVILGQLTESLMFTSIPGVEMFHASSMTSLCSKV